MEESLLSYASNQAPVVVFMVIFMILVYKFLQVFIKKITELLDKKDILISKKDDELKEQTSQLIKVHLMTLESIAKASDIQKETTHSVEKLIDVIDEHSRDVRMLTNQINKSGV